MPFFGRFVSVAMPSRNRYRFVQIHPKCRYTFEETLQSAFRTTLSRFAFQKEIYREKVTIAIPSGNLNFSTLPVSFLRKKSRFWFYSCQPRFTAVFLRNTRVSAAFYSCFFTKREHAEKLVSGAFYSCFFKGTRVSCVLQLFS